MRKEWIEVHLHETAKVLNGFAFKSELFDGQVGMPLIRIRDLPNGNFTETRFKGEFQDQYVVRKGDFLIGMDGEFRCYEWQGKDALLNQRVCRIQDFKTELVDPKYLYLNVNGYLERIEADTGFTTVKHISAKQILEIKFPLPPLQEQKRIVDLISSVDSYIDSLQQQVNSARKSRSAVLHEMLSAGGDDWTETTLGEVAEVIDPHPSHRAPPVDEEGIPFVGIGDLRNPRDIDFNKARKVSKQVLIEHMARYSRSDYLIGLGRVASIGMVVLLPGEHVDYAVSPTLAVIKPTGVMNEFLFYLLEGPQAQGQFQTMKKGSTRESVGMQVLRKIRVLVPPLQEQKRIVDLISLMDKAISATERAVTESKNLRSGLLSDLLSGDHEIPSSYDSVMGAA
jgi:type I restriction enzyme S subunit